MTVAVGGSVQQISNCLDDLRETLSGLDDRDIVQALRDIEVLSRKARSVMLDVVAEVDSRGIAAREGFGSTARLVAGMLRPQRKPGPGWSRPPWWVPAAR